MSAEPPETGAEQRLRHLLELIRSAPPAPPADLPKRVVDTARWERGVRNTSQAIGGFGASIAEGLAILLGIRKPPR
jgi:hypothetical protein